MWGVMTLPVKDTMSKSFFQVTYPDTPYGPYVIDVPGEPGYRPVHAMLVWFRKRGYFRYNGICVHEVMDKWGHHTVGDGFKPSTPPSVTEPEGTTLERFGDKVDSAWGWFADKIYNFSSPFGPVGRFLNKVYYRATYR